MQHEPSYYNYEANKYDPNTITSYVQTGES